MSSALLQKSFPSLMCECACPEPTVAVLKEVAVACCSHLDFAL